MKMTQQLQLTELKTGLKTNNELQIKQYNHSKPGIRVWRVAGNKSFTNKMSTKYKEVNV